MSEEHDNHGTFIAVIAFLILLILYITIGSWMEIKHFCIGHETGVIILIGMLVSVVAEHVDEDA